MGVVRQYYYESGDNLAYIAHVKNGPYDIISVNFRGTQGLTALTNWLVNVDAWKHDFPCPDAPAGLTCKVHSGFRDSYDGLVVAGLLAELRSLIDEVTTASEAYPRVILTGHSLGGAMATIAAYDFALVQGIEVFGLYTQGCPRVFETVTRNWLESLRKFPVWRSTFGEDPVTRIPLDSMGFQHVGVEIYGMGTYEDDGTGTLSAQLEGDGSGEAANTEAAKGLFSTSVGDHGPGPGNYVMHGGSNLVATTASPCAGTTKTNPKDYGYASCEAKCAAMTGSSGHEYLGNGPACWSIGDSSDCDTECRGGYCSYAHERFTVAPAASLASRVPLSARRPPRRTIPTAGPTGAAWARAGAPAAATPSRPMRPSTRKRAPPLSNGPFQILIRRAQSPKSQVTSASRLANHSPALQSGVDDSRPAPVDQKKPSLRAKARRVFVSARRAAQRRSSCLQEAILLRQKNALDPVHGRLVSRPSSGRGMAVFFSG